MSKVYIVTEGCYSDYHIVAIFSDYHKAELYRRLHKCDEVEEWEVDEIDLEGIKPPTPCINIYYKPFAHSPITGEELVYVTEDDISKIKAPIILSKECGVFCVQTDNIIKAKKVFYDEYMKALNEWLIECEKEIERMGQEYEQTAD